MGNRILSDARGVTLVEVLVAIVLMALLALSVFAAITQSAVFSKRMDMVYVATNLAQMRIDELKRFDFQQVYPGGEESDIVVDENGNMDANGLYVRDTDITYPYDGNGYLLKIKVTVDKAKVNIDGTKTMDPVSGKYELSGYPVTMETLLSNTEATT